MMKTLKFTVAMKVPREVMAADLKDYIHDACTSWGGHFHPDDPLFGLDETQVVVKVYRSKNARSSDIANKPVPI
jgi:hypothetical protein